MKKIITIVLFIFISFSARAKIYIDITSPGTTKLGVALKFSGRADKIASVVKKDLITYGIFRIYPVDNISFSLADLKLIGADLYLKSTVSIKEQVTVSFEIKDTATGETLISKIIEGSKGTETTIAHRIADLLYEVTTGNKGMFSYPAVAVRRVASGYELCLLDIGAKRYSRLLFANRPILSPALSPDRKKVAFSLMRKGDFDIYILDIAKGIYKKACSTKGPDTAPVWTPDGKGIIFSGQAKDNTEIFFCNISTGEIKRLTKHIGIDTSPSISPDGSKIAFVSSRTGRPNIYIMNLKTGKAYRISSGYYDVSPEWSPDGTAIIYSSIFQGSYLLKLYFLESGVTQIVGIGEDPTWSPNGDYIVFKRFDGLYLKSLYGNFEIKIFSGRWENPFWR